jgi:hypothetical protein
MTLPDAAASLIPKGFLGSFGFRAGLRNACFPRQEQAAA